MRLLAPIGHKSGGSIAVAAMQDYASTSSCHEAGISIEEEITNGPGVVIAVPTAKVVDGIEMEEAIQRLQDNYKQLWQELVNCNRSEMVASLLVPSWDI